MACKPTRRLRNTVDRPGPAGLAALAGLAGLVVFAGLDAAEAARFLGVVTPPRLVRKAEWPRSTIWLIAESTSTPMPH